MLLRLELVLLIDQSEQKLFLDDNDLDLQLNMRKESQNIFFPQHPIGKPPLLFLIQPVKDGNYELRINVQF